MIILTMMLIEEIIVIHWIIPAVVHKQINVIPKGLEKYMSFSINNKLGFIDSF